jgi:hypothetical protein
LTYHFQIEWEVNKMKKFIVIGICIMVVGLVAGDVFAQAQYTIDNANPQPLELTTGECATVTIRLDPAGVINDPLLTGGFSLVWDSTQVSVNESTGVAVYDGLNGPAGPWDSGFTTSFLFQPGQWILQVGNFGTVPIDQPILLADVEFCCEAAGQSVISILPVPGVDCWASNNGTVWDSQIGEGIINVDQQGAGCTSDIECDDGVYCTIDTCDLGTGECQNSPDNGLCGDGDVCNGIETCDPIDGCQPGTPLDCDDGDLCTIDSCDPVTGCDNAPVECPEGEFCDPADGQCKECTIDEDCDDGDICNGVETCEAGTCIPGTPLDCDDGNLCTIDSCDPVTGCDNAPVECPPGEFCDPADGLCKVPAECTVDEDCDDEDICNGVETCDAGTCLPGTPLDCDDGNLCTIDSCDPVTGCDNVPVECPPGEECDPADGLCKAPAECTVDEDCDDEDICNGVETCDAGTCIPGTPLDCDDGDVCNGIETCDPVDGCQSGTPLDCDDGNLCTIDSCDPVTGCDNAPVECPPGEECDPADGLCKVPAECTVDEDCDDGISCTVDICDQGSCQNTPDNGLCDDGVGCTDDTCIEGVGCRHFPNDENCLDDGVYCNGEEFCDPVNDCSSTGDPCPAGTECIEETETCEPTVGIVVDVDIDPYECPNKLNLESPYKVRVTIIGTAELDVATIDPGSLVLSREGVEGGVPVARVGGVGDVRFDYYDRSTPFDGELCTCADCDIKGACGPDGYMDMSGYFKISELAEVLKLDEVAGQRIPLTLTGMLKEEAGGTPLSGKDCVDVMEQCKGDFDCDGDVDGGDTEKMKKNFGWDKDDSTCQDKDNCAGDFDKDGDIDSTDINAFKKTFGSGPYKGSPCGYEECKGDFDCDSDVDGQDAKKFTDDFGRSPYTKPCEEGGDDACFGDFDGDKDCDGKDAADFKKDFGRSPLKDPCKGCVVQ